MRQTVGLQGALIIGQNQLHGDPQARCPTIWSAAFSATMMVGALVFEDGMNGIIEASATRRPLRPITRKSGPPTLSSSCVAPMRQVPTGWWSVLACAHA